MTKVVSVRAKFLRPEYDNLKKWVEDARNVYIGRGGIVDVGAQKWCYASSIWANPFKITETCSREDCIRLFEHYIREKIESENLREQLLSLKGKRLGCWCKPEACHGDILLKLIDEYSMNTAFNPEQTCNLVATQEKLSHVGFSNAPTPTPVGKSKEHRLQNDSSPAASTSSTGGVMQAGMPKWSSILQGGYPIQDMAQNSAKTTASALETITTEVVNVKASYLRPKYSNLREWCENSSNIYIGRRGMVLIGKEHWSYEDSIWANPYKRTQMSSKDERLGMYETYIREKIEREHLQDQLLSLRGKKLGCWCKPEGCHGDILVRLIEEYYQNSLNSTQPSSVADDASVTITANKSSSRRRGRLAAFSSKSFQSDDSEKSHSAMSSPARPLDCPPASARPATQDATERLDNSIPVKLSHKSWSEVLKSAPSAPAPGRADLKPKA